jgi:hypothetical protein
MQRIPHHPEYIARLGAAVYAFAYTEWLMFEVVRLADPTISIAKLVAMHASEIAPALRRGLRKRGIASDIPDRWAGVVQSRHDIVHAHPATDEVEGQRLYRWRPGRAHFVSNERLTEFIVEVEQLNSDANDLRIALRGAPVAPSAEPDRSAAVGAHVTFSDAD